MRTYDNIEADVTKDKILVNNFIKSWNNKFEDPSVMKGVKSFLFNVCLYDPHNFLFICRTLLETFFSINV